MSTSSLAVVATGFSVFALVIVVVLVVQVGRLRRAYDALVAGDGFVSEVHGARRAVEELRVDLQRLREQAAHRDGPAAITRVAVVRYDAFGDLAGALSYSAALLDGDGNGLVLTSINGRSETRSYAKGVQGGRSDAPLSPEEQEAIAGALRPADDRGRADRLGAPA